MIVTLIGYRGSGKSSVARPLAARWGWTAVDADDVIEQRAGRTIREIFSQSGEAEFRRLERETIADLVRQSSLVLAAGGGAILDEATRHALRAAGPVVWLRAPVDELAARIAQDATTADRRPNLTSAGGIDEIERVLAEREPLYRQCATLVVETGGRTLDDVVASLARELDPLVRSGGAP